MFSHIMFSDAQLWAVLLFIGILLSVASVCVGIVIGTLLEKLVAWLRSIVSLDKEAN